MGFTVIKNYNIDLYLLSIKTLVKNNSYTPHINFRGNFWRIFPNHKTFWGQIPEKIIEMKTALYRYINVKASQCIPVGACPL